VPGDKSISHRAMMLNALCVGKARVRDALYAEDVQCTMAALRAFGVKFEKSGHETIVCPPEAGLQEPRDIIDCGNSGTSMRLLSGIASTHDFLTVLTGDTSLRKRPMDRVVHPLRKMGARIDGREGGRLCPLAIRGGKLSLVHYDLPVASAQVKSALLVAGLRSGVAVREPHHSRDHTERMLLRMGVAVRRTPEDWLVLLPADRLSPVDVDVPGDLSAAAFFLVAGAIVPGSEIYLPNVGVNPTRTGVLEVLDRMGADIQIFPIDGKGPEPAANICARHGQLIGTTISGELALRCIDELPVLAIAAAFAVGETVIRDAAELRVKESDRIARVVTGLRSLGIEVEERPDGMVIQGGRPVGTGVADGTGDHRVAMAFAVAGMASPRGIAVVGAESVRSSYPDFQKNLEALIA
jgi:3-phosphoshikimate 1-carboxyvinyltransferase